jgi:hypothetical protein
MPRLNHEATIERFSYEVQMAMTLLLQEIDALRQAVSVPPRTPQQRRQALRQYLRDHPHPTRQGGEA